MPGDRVPPPRIRSLVVLTVLICVVAFTSAHAHPVAQGAMDIQISPERIVLHLRASMEEVFVESALAKSGETGIGPAEQVRRHGEYLLRHVHCAADDEVLSGRVTEAALSMQTGGQRAIYTLEYPLTRKPARIRLDQNVLNEFDFAPGNRWEATYVVKVTQPGGAAREGLLLTSRDPLAIGCDWSAARPDGSAIVTLDRWGLTKAYVRHGVFHILTGYDHLLFIGGLVLAVVTLWDLVKVISAFTLAHSITLTLSVLNVVRLPGRVVEPIIALSIVFVAVQNVFWPARTRGASRLGVAFFFGLFHGLGFAGGLLDAMQGMTGLAVGLAIVAFSIGVELGHQVVVIPVFGALTILRQGEVQGPRVAAAIFRYGSAAIAMAGLFFLVAALR